MSTTQTFREILTDLYSTQVLVNRTSKQQMHGYGTCATVVLMYSYSMNFIFLLVVFGFRKRKKKKKIWLLSKRVLLFFINVFFSIALKYVQLN